MNGTKQIAQRIVNAENAFIETIIEISGCTHEQAVKIFNVYKRERIIKLFSFTRYEVKHGAFLEKDVIEKAINI